MVYTQEMKIGQEIACPKAWATFVLTDIRHDAQFRGHPVGDAFIGRLDAAERARRRRSCCRSVSRPSTGCGAGRWSSRSTSSRRGITPACRSTRTPGVDVVYVGFILMILGCYVTFFRSHQQVCIEASPPRDRHAGDR